jgi:hypothetical protein
MSKNRTRAERSAARQRFVEKERHAESFVASIKGSVEYHQLQGSTNSRMIEQNYSGCPKGLKRSIPFYRFEGVTTEQGMMISDQSDRWALIDELQSELEKLESVRGKGKAQRRRIEQLAVLIDAPL